jgi:hypothetical protein
MPVSCLIVYRTETAVGGAHRAPRALSSPLMSALGRSSQLPFRSTMQEGREENFSVNVIGEY